jgi:glycosyltransferase 2 family protein
MLRTFIKVAISALLLFVLVRSYSLTALSEQILAVNRVALAAAALSYAAVALPSAWRWCIVTTAIGHKLEFRRSLTFVLIGYFFNLTIVSSVGGDAVRMWKAHRAGLPGMVAVSSVIIERLTQVLAHLFIVAGSVPILFYRVHDTTMRVAIVLLLALGAVCFGILLMLDRLPPKLRKLRIFGASAQFSSYLRLVLLNPAAAAPAILLGFVNQITVVAVIWMLAVALRLHISFSDCLIAVPAALLVTALPITISGWGLREGAFVVGFGYLGLAGSDAFTLSVLFGLLNTIVRLPGGFVWLLTTDR